jgi:hypothetical protein
MLSEMKSFQVPHYVWHYSPRPMAEYSQKVPGGGSYGPFQSPFLARTEAWNLAWLSHDFERQPLHPDANFTTLIRRTIDFVVKDGVEDITRAAPLRLKIRGVMRLDPDDAVAQIVAMKYLPRVPLFAAYGRAWVTTMQGRIATCRINPAKVLEASMDVEVSDFSDAMTVLARLR